MERSAVCTFTGHREAKLPWRENEADPRCLALKQAVYDAAEALYAAGVRHYICGMANGGDMYFGEAVLALREEHPEITLEAAVPFPGQAERWRIPLRKRYDRLLSACDVQTLICKSYTPDCMMRRNRYMVDAAGYLISAYQGGPGGTQATLLYAIRQGLEVIQLPIEE